ncbi:MAG: hypothetical protein COB99_05825, partial [Sulfurimonas sp.]
EMIGNIAHQWRQPLMQLSAIFMYLDAYQEKGKLTPEKFDKKIKFYETYILKTNKNTKVELKDIKEGYLLKFNFSSGRMIKRSLILIVVLSTVSTMILDYRFAIVYFFMIIYLYSMVALSRYIYSFYKGNKTLFVDNIILIGNNDKDGIGIPLQIINEKEKTLIKSYVKKFLNKNIDEFEKHIFNVPLTKTENIINVDTKIGDSNGR